MNADPRLADLLVEWEERVEKGEQVNVDDLCQDCPELADELRKQVAVLEGAQWLKKPAAAADPDQKDTPPEVPQPSFWDHIGKFFDNVDLFKSKPKTVPPPCGQLHSW